MSNQSAFLGRSAKDIKVIYGLASNVIAEKLIYLSITPPEVTEEAPIVYAIYPDPGNAALTLADYITFPTGSVIIDGHAGVLYVKKSDNTWANQA